MKFVTLNKEQRLAMVTVLRLLVVIHRAFRDELVLINWISEIGFAVDISTKSRTYKKKFLLLKVAPLGDCRPIFVTVNYLGTVKGKKTTWRVESVVADRGFFSQHYDENGEPIGDPTISPSYWNYIKDNRSKT